jgi:uncharacterized protein YycO
MKNDRHSTRSLSAAMALGTAAGWIIVRRIQKARHERVVVGSAKGTGYGRRTRPQPGDILLFFRPNRLRDYLIEAVTGSRFYHAALFAGDDRVIEASPAGVWENTLRGREGEFVTLPAPDGAGKQALAWARTQIGDPFDNLDVGVIFLERLFRGWRINYTMPGRYSCAELVADAFRHAGVDLIPDNKPSETAPADLAKRLALISWNEEEPAATTD